MKKHVFILLLSFILLTGCSSTQNTEETEADVENEKSSEAESDPEATELSEAIGKYWEERIEYEKLLNDADIYKGDPLKTNVSPTEAESILVIINVAKAKLSKYYDAAKKSNENLKAINESLKKMNGDTKAEDLHKTVAELIKSELNLSGIISKMNIAYTQYFTYISNNMPPPNINFQELYSQHNQMREQLIRLNEAFKEKWSEFHKDATGENLEINRNHH